MGNWSAEPAHVRHSEQARRERQSAARIEDANRSTRVSDVTLAELRERQRRERRG